MERIKCTIEHIVFSNPDNGYTVVRASEHGVLGCHTMVGTLLGIGVGMTIVANGEWKNNPKFGKQFSIESWHEELPATIKGIECYLSSGLIKGIGPLYASRIVKRFGIDTFTIFDYAPERLLEVEGIGKARMEKIRNCRVMASVLRMR